MLNAASTIAADLPVVAGIAVVNRTAVLVEECDGFEDVFSVQQVQSVTRQTTNVDVGKTIIQTYTLTCWVRIL
jgi:hypothetical protein